MPNINLTKKALGYYKGQHINNPIETARNLIGGRNEI